MERAFERTGKWQCYDVGTMVAKKVSSPKMKIRFRIAIAFAILLGSYTVTYAAPAAGVGQMFRLDGGDTTYVFGGNERGELQAIYWGGKLATGDKVAAAHSLPEMASFDPPATTTPQEYAAWGAGLYTEPALKVTFADGDRDLVLHYVSSKSTGSAYEILTKDILREIYVTLRYAMDTER